MDSWLAAVSVFLFLVPQTAQTDAKAGILFKAPAGWTVTTQAGRTTMVAPGGGVTMLEFAPDAATLEDAAKALPASLAPEIQAAAMSSEGEPLTLNGMALRVDEGSGQAGGVAVVWEAYILNANHPAIMVTFGAPAAIGKAAKQINGVYQSLMKTL